MLYNNLFSPRSPRNQIFISQLGDGSRLEINRNISINKNPMALERKVRRPRNPDVWKDGFSALRCIVKYMFAD